jgi:hypothetical protein
MKEIALAVLLALSAASGLRADTFSDTAASGTMSLNTINGGPTFSLFGDGFALTSSGAGSFGPCGIISIPDSPGIVSIEQCFFVFLSEAATLTMNGSTQPVFVYDSVVGASEGSMAFFAGPSEVTMSEPASLLGTLTICAASPDPALNDDPGGEACVIPNEFLGSVAINAAGSFTIDLTLNSDGTYNRDSEIYAFGSPVSMPEPGGANLLLVALLGIGLLRGRFLLSRN